MKRRINPGSIIALVGLAAAASIPLFTSNPYYLQKYQLIGILIIAVQGLNMMAGYAGQISLGHAGLFAVGAYASAKLALSLEWGFIPGFIGAVLVTAIVGLLLGFPARRVRHHYLAIVTIGFGIMVERLANEGGEFTGGFAGLSGIPGLLIFGGELDATGTYYVILAVAAVTTWSLANLVQSRTGRAFLALREGELAAESLGISEYRYKLIAFLLGSLGAGMAGSLYTHVFHYVSPESFTFQVSVEMLVMLLLGGMGTVAGPILGVVALQLLPELINDLDAYRLIIYGGLLLAVILGFPGGVVGLIPRRWLRRDEPLPDEAELEKLQEEAADLLRQGAAKRYGGAVLEVAGLTEREVAELDEVLRSIKGLGITILLIEHDMRLVMGVSDEITVLESGQVICAGSPEQVQANPRVVEAYLGETAAD